MKVDKISDIPSIVNEKYQIISMMGSFRNKVYLLSEKNDSKKHYILKIYSGSSRENKCLVESKNLNFLYKNKIKVPKVLEKSDYHIIMEYLPGESVANLLSKNDYCWVDDLAKWMAKLHKISAESEFLTKGDCNLRNFLWNKEIYGLDFENDMKGNPKIDLGDLSFFILTNSPPLTPCRLELFENFITKYEEYSGKRVKFLSDYIAQSAEKAYLRRIEYNRI